MITQAGGVSSTAFRKRNAACACAKVADAFKAKGDWCEEHNRAESQCFKCDPTPPKNTPNSMKPSSATEAETDQIGPRGPSAGTQDEFEENRKRDAFPSFEGSIGRPAGGSFATTRCLAYDGVTVAHHDSTANETVLMKATSYFNRGPLFQDSLAPRVRSSRALCCSSAAPRAQFRSRKARGA